MEYIRCILVGDNDIGKAYFLESLTTIFDFNSLNAIVNGKEYHLLFELIAKAANYKSTRHYDYCNQDLVILCFSLVSPESLENIEKIYYFSPIVLIHITY
ncbi:Rho GTPase protein rac1 [Tritrichomonas musculus]|uniref:Rho GTPase protein rac1 n=1 Tax=Tritrichomonas musculus TaxID=1915356 RepID=A0ABR2GW63_9EUKA